MAAPAWATNLTTFWLTGATTVTALGGGGAGLSNPETDFFIEGTDSISKGAWTNNTKGFIVDALGTTFTVPTDGAVLFFAKYDAAGSLDTKTNGGFQGIIGSASNAYDHFYIGGKDTLAFNSWFPYVIDPNTATADSTTGSPSGSERWVGILASLPTTSGPTKGNPIAIDAIRYGRCDIEYTAGDLGNGYNTFDGCEAYANDATRRWGLNQFESGVYLIQGFHSLGVSGTAVDFRDSNKVLFWRASGNNNLTNDAVSTGFNRIEIINTSSNVDWDNIILQALGTRAKGVFVHTAGTFDAVNCQFVDMDTFTFISTSTLTGTIFRRCALITAGTGTFTDCQFIEGTASASVVTADLEDFTDCYFESDGSNHALELTSIGSGSMTWANTLSGYVAGAAGSPVTPTSTGNEAIYVNVGSGTLTINVASGATLPSIRSAGATVNVVSSFTLTLTDVPSGVQVTIVNSSTRTELQNSTSSGADITYGHAGGETVDILFMHNDYDPNSSDIYDLTLPSSDSSIKISLGDDLNYENL